MKKGKILSLKEASDYSGMSVRTIQRKIEKGKIIPVWALIVKHIEKRKLVAYMKTDEYKARKK